MKKILVVDDDKDLLFLLEERLKTEGYEVLTADNAESALTLARSEEADLVILDIMMPGKDGTYVAEELHSDPKTSKLPVIFLTGLYSKEEEKSKGHQVAGKVFLAKPYRVEDLLVEIEKLT